MGDVDNLTVEILKQIRDGVFELKTEVAGVKEEVAGVKEEVATLRVEMREELGELKTSMAQVSRINDETLRFSLQDAGRMDSLEGRVRTLEAEMHELRSRKP